ncbi:Repeat domain-containing protein [Streptomyces sp. 3213]|uniref:FG-GAP repeat domain-containing protein n=1 Tax=Streptomyces sp. 3213.3 TaxID=1855348 RepID=UPI0008960366|nr:VCBS repeat-containing protein [Streptomyces sp. 3213.3]SEE07121.1 Repeat domain-containing protein [Streptomyces sp. 3213] [Streptomyces sp. 3213.3]
MARRVFTGIAVSAVLAAGLGPLLPTPALAVGDAQETVVPATLRGTYTSAALLASSTQGGHDSAGAQGVFHRVEGVTPTLWTRYSDGVAVPVPVRAGASIRATGTDVLAYQYPDGRFEFWDPTDGTTRSLQVPAGLGVLSAFDNLTLAFRNSTAEDGTSTRIVHLLTPGPDGTTRDVTVTGGPAGLIVGLPAGTDATSVFFRSSLDGQQVLIAVDRETGQVQSTSGPLPLGYTHVYASRDHVVVAAYDKAKVLVLPRADLSATPAEVVLKGVTDGVNATHDLALVGDWLVNGTGAVTAQPIAGGASVTLMPSSSFGIAAGPDGNAVKIGRTGSDDWGIQRIQPGPAGVPVVTQVRTLPKPPARIQGLSLEQGRLLVADTGGPNGYRDDYIRTVSVTGTPEFGARSSFDGAQLNLGTCPVTELGCSQLYGTADGRAAWLTKDTTTSDRIRVNGPAPYTFWERTVPAGGRITDVSGRYLIHTTATAQTVYRIGNDGNPALTRTPGAAALSGDTLWTSGTTPGTLTAYNLTTGKTTETLTTDTGCAPTELRANGRWLYWRCADGTAGVYDRTAKKSVQVPSGEAELGDGFVVTHDRQAGQLVLTTFADGTPASRVIGALPDTGVSQREVRWTVDESTGNVAYVDDQERVHLVPVGVPQQPLRLLAPVEAAPSVQAHERDTTEDTLATVLLSKPSASWRLTVRDRATGKVVDTRDGGAARGELKVGWSASFGATLLTNGSYDWTLSVAPADGVGAPVTASGTVAVRGGSPARHDHVGGDAVGDLLTLDPSGALTYQLGTGKGGFAGKVTGAGWPTSVKAVPFGDLNGDHCNDVLVRLSSGALRAYRPACDAALKPSTAYTSLGTSGWNQYDVLTAPGDISGDGRPDLIARNASTGAVYLYKGTSAGKLSARVKLYADWKTYKKVVGVGDVNGDGIGDLLAQDKSNNLYRYYGTGHGTFGARVKLFTAWGGSYNTVVGVGDITGDGKADLVERDSAGVLYRNSGDGKGSFGARVKIATGWGGYRGIF